MACKTNKQCDFCDARCPEWYDDKIFHTLNNIYDAYKEKTEWMAQALKVSKKQENENAE